MEKPFGSDIVLNCCFSAPRCSKIIPKQAGVGEEGSGKNDHKTITGEQMSLLFSGDKQEIDGITYGWYPENGKDAYIQRRMGAIFADTMRRIFPVK